MPLFLAQREYLAGWRVQENLSPLLSWPGQQQDTGRQGPPVPSSVPLWQLQARCGLPRGSGVLGLRAAGSWGRLPTRLLQTNALEGEALLKKRQEGHQGDLPSIPSS